MYRDYDFDWGRERATQIRREVEHNRLEARLARARLSKHDGGLEEAVVPKSLTARSAAVLMALFR